MDSARTHSPAAAGSLVSLLNRVPAPVAGAFRSDGLLARLARPLLGRLLPAGLTTVVVRSGPARGLRFPIYPRSEKFYWTGTWEPHVQQALERTLAPGGRFWDVGAHVGFFALLAERLVQPGGEVTAFEPIPENCVRLRENIRLNRAAVRVVSEALSHEPGVAQMQMRAGSSFMWTLECAADGSPTSAVTVSTLDANVDRYGRPDVVKIDAEGAEVEVLRGASALIAESKTTFLVEFTSDDLVESARALMPGYDFKLAGANHWLIEPSPP